MLSQSSFRILISLSLLSLCLFAYSCKETKENELGRESSSIIVSFGEKNFTKEDLRAKMPQNILYEDSLQMLDMIVNSWIQDQVWLKKAKESKFVSEDDFAKQIEAYKNSLLIHSYKNHILKQRLDTNVSSEEIEEYYTKHKSEFFLKSNIVRVRFVKVPKKSTKLGKIKKEIFAQPFTEKNRENLSRYCYQEADNYYLEDNQWLFFNDLLKEVPIQTYNQESFLKDNRNIEINTEDYIYYLSILDFKVKDMVSPLNFETERIRQIILNTRKRNILQSLNEELMQEVDEKQMIRYNK